MGVVRIWRCGLCAKLRMSHRGRKKSKIPTVPEDEVWMEEEPRKRTEAEVCENDGNWNLERHEEERPEEGGTPRPDVEERPRRRQKFPLNLATLK